MLPKNKNTLKWMRFSGIAIQMGVVIWLGNVLGEYIDKRTNRNDELWTKIITLSAVFLAMFSVIREVIKIGKDQ
jgi:membrane protein DedA with SNARE-associated domain